MNAGAFHRSLRETRPILEDLGVLRPPMRMARAPNEVYRRLALSGRASYGEVFRCGLEVGEYIFLLTDLSYLQFYHEQGGGAPFGVRYAFHPNPFPFMPFEEFLDTYELSGSDPEAIEFYHQHLSELSSFDGVGPLRYEVDFQARRPLRHATAHLHLGHRTPARLPVERVLLPKAFTLFAVKHFFPNAWREPDADDGVPHRYDDLLRDERDACAPVAEEHFSEQERGEFFLT